VISYRQLLACGLTADAVRHRRKTSRLHSLYRSVYLVGHRAAPEGGRQWACVLACGAHAALSLHSAGAWWSMSREKGDMVDVASTVNCGSKPGLRFHHTSEFGPRDLRSKRGLPVTSPARTLIDLAGALSERALERGRRGHPAAACP
jgi:hypothetical protein